MTPLTKQESRIQNLLILNFCSFLCFILVCVGGVGGEVAGYVTESSVSRVQDKAL